jgi:tetratricopeptide (TPR) repeat protein
MSTYCRAAAVACLIFVSIAAEAELPYPQSKPTESEWRLLPKYCPDTQGLGKYGRNSPNAPKWIAMMGETFWALHHYCFGILKFNRSQMSGYPSEVRQGLKRSALGEFGFVTRLMPQNYVLAPEIYTYVGRTHLLLDELEQANEAFAKARRARPDYWPAYSWEATYLADHGAKDRARALVLEGLQHAPDSRTLQLILKDLERQRTSR